MCASEETLLVTSSNRDGEIQILSLGERVLDSSGENSYIAFDTTCESSDESGVLVFENDVRADLELDVEGR